MTSPAAQAIEDFFAGGAKAAKFPDGQFGTVIGGQITTDPRMTQQRDYTTDELIFYPDGNPAMQMVVTVQAEQPSGDDDGQRSLYIKGQLKQAVGDALRKHGEKAPRRGGSLWVKYVEDKPVTLKNGKSGNPQKIFAAKYDPPAAAAAGQFFDDPAPQPATNADSMRASGNRAAPPAAAGTLPCPANVPPAKWAAMNAHQQEQMYDALGMAPPRVTASFANGPAGSQFTDEPPF